MIDQIDHTMTVSVLIVIPKRSRHLETIFYAIEKRHKSKYGETIVLNALNLPGDELDESLVQRDAGFRIENTAVCACHKIRRHDLSKEIKFSCGFYDFHSVTQ